MQAVGDTITLSDGRTFPITAVVPDQVLGGYEMASSDQVLTVPAKQPAAYLLVGGMASVSALQAVMKAQLPTRTVRVKVAHGQRLPELVRHGAHPARDQAPVRRVLAQDRQRRGVRAGHHVDHTWIRTRTITQLGPVECNKAILPDLEAAMKEVTADKLGSLDRHRRLPVRGRLLRPRGRPVLRRRQRLGPQLGHRGRHQRQEQPARRQAAPGPTAGRDHGPSTASPGAAAGCAPTAPTSSGSAPRSAGPDLQDRLEA